MKDWKECTLEDIAFINPQEVLPKGTLAKKIPMEFLVPYTKKIAGHLVEPYKGGTKFRNEDTLVSRITPCLENGKIAFVDILDDDELAFGSTEYIVLRSKKDKSDSNFIYYFATSNEFRDLAILSMTGSSGRQRVQIDVLKNHAFLLPPLKEQQAIAKVLSELDNKIELLHQQNQTLESLAETLFRQWFIEEAKEDWEESSLASIAQFLNGLACQKFLPENDVDKLPVLKIRELRNGISDATDWATSNVKEEYVVELGDVIFAWSASLMVKIWNGQKCVLNQHLFKVTSSKYPKWFYYFWCKHHLAEFIAISVSHATTMGHIKRSDLEVAKVLIPTDEEITQMSQVIEPFLLKTLENYKQLITLTKLRDSLLPKLISGEIRLPLA